MISVIVPIYKVEPYLQQCVDSILNQTYRDLEVLLIDDGSPDRCGEICDEYERKDNRIRVFHTENKGLSAARNLGLQEATGEYIGFVDSDDWIEPDMYEVLLKRIQETSADICICGFWNEYGTMSSDGIAIEAIYSRDDALKSLIDGIITDHVWSKLYRKTLFQNISFPEGVYFEDILTFYHLVRESRLVVVIPKRTYHYRNREKSISQTHSAKNLIEYAEAHHIRYFDIKKNNYSIFCEKQEELDLLAFQAIARALKWWFESKQEERKNYVNRLSKLCSFSRESIPTCGYRSWPLSLKMTALLVHCRNSKLVTLLYRINQLFKKTRLWI